MTLLDQFMTLEYGIVVLYNLSETDDPFFLVLKGLEDRIDILENKKFKRSMLYQMYLKDLKFLYEFIASITLEEPEKEPEKIVQSTAIMVV